MGGSLCLTFTFVRGQCLCRMRVSECKRLCTVPLEFGVFVANGSRHGTRVWTKNHKVWAPRTAIRTEAPSEEGVHAGQSSVTGLPAVIT
eukprot:4785646-Amphidinium_carterae.1